MGKKRNKSKLVINYAVIGLIGSLLLNIFYMYKDGKYEKSYKEERVEKIIQRLTNINTNKYYAINQAKNISSTSYLEVADLIDEIIKISNEDNDYLSGNQYIYLIKSSLYSKKYDEIPYLIKKAEERITDNISITSLNDQKSRYYYDIILDFKKGRECQSNNIIIYNKIKNKTKRLYSIMFEYADWSAMEYNSGNFKKSDSLLIIADKIFRNNEKDFYWKLNKSKYIYEEIENVRKMLNDNINYKTFKPYPLRAND